jgi:hypothetical protein
MPPSKSKGPAPLSQKKRNCAEMLRQVFDALLLPARPKCAKCAHEANELARLESRMCKLERTVYHHHDVHPAPHDSVQCIEQMLRVMERAIGEPN